MTAAPELRPFCEPDVKLDLSKKLSAEDTPFGHVEEHVLPRFEEEEVILGRVLGQGSFCVAIEVESIKLNSHCRTTKDETAREERRRSLSYDQPTTRKFIVDQCQGARTCTPYIIKKISDRCLNDPQGRLSIGINHLATESRILSLLDHRNIIKRRATSNVEPFKEDYFLILDRLSETLEQRLVVWKTKTRKSKSVVGRLTRGKKKQNMLQKEQLRVAADLASAMAHMHDERIIYRDMKPENVGFDARGDVKIFDMGLAKELCDEIQHPDGTYNLTGFTGTLRYMAPEVAMAHPYNLSADVYSFGVLLWQMMSLEIPFNAHSTKTHFELVFKKGCRPSCEKSWPSEWSKIIKQCWSQDASKRPQFNELAESLGWESHILDGFDSLASTSKLRESFRTVSTSKLSVAET